MAVLFSRRPLGLIYMSFVALVASAPDDCNNLTEQTSGWVEGPDGRGTGDILYSCIFTISLCVLTALHLNVPPIGSSFTHRAKRKAGWVIVGIFAPEAVVYAALVQLITVKRFQEKLTKVVEDDLEKAKNVQSTTVQHKKSRLLSPIREDSDPTDQAGPTKPIRRAATNIQLINVDSAAETSHRNVFPDGKIPLRYAWYVVMGGFVLDISRIHDLYRDMTITHHGVLRLAQNGLYLPVSDESISDKSKADLLAKGLVFCQVAFLAVQCIARKVQGLPVTLLEIHTVVHVCCAIAMYSIWMQKPLDINDPTRADDWVWHSTEEEEREKWRRCIANMLMFSTHMESWHSERRGSINTKCAEIDFALNLSSRRVMKESSRKIGGSHLNVYTHDTSLALMGKTHRLRTITRGSSSKTTNQVLKIKSGQSIESNIGPAIIGHDHLELVFSEKATKRWVLGLDPNAYSCPVPELDPSTNSVSEADRCDHHPYFEDKIANFSSPSYEQGVLTTFCLWVLCLTYGGVHALGWNFTFPSPTEEKCWRIACPLLVILGGPISELMRLAIQSHRNQTHGRNDERGLVGVLRFFAWFVSTLSLPAYIAARIFLVAEALVSLRQVPVGTYASINWARFIPHI